MEDDLFWIRLDLHRQTETETDGQPRYVGQTRKWHVLGTVYKHLQYYSDVGWSRIINEKSGHHRIGAKITCPLSFIYVKTLFYVYISSVGTCVTLEATFEPIVSCFFKQFLTLKNLENTVCHKKQYYDLDCRSKIPKSFISETIAILLESVL